KRFAWPYRRARVISPGWQAFRLHWVRSPQPTRLPLQFQFCAWRGSNAPPTAPKRIGLKSHRRLSGVLIKSSRLRHPTFQRIFGREEEVEAQGVQQVHEGVEPVCRAQQKL